MTKFVRIAHLSAFRQSAGVQRQLMFEQKAARKLAPQVKWEVHTFLAEPPLVSNDGDEFSPTFVAPRYIPTPLRIWMAHWQLFQWLRNNGTAYDFVLLRWPTISPFTLVNGKLLKQVFTVHHTKEVEELCGLGGWIMKVRAILEDHIGPLLLRKVRGIIGVTNEIIQYELNRINTQQITFLYPNGVVYETLPLARVDAVNSHKRIVFLMVASHFYPWHGLDLIFQSAQNNKSDFIFNIVGTVPSEIRQKIKKDSRFHCHGPLNATQIGQLARQSDIGVSSLALFRKNMTEACPLKAREYLALGLPVIGGYIDSGLPKDFPYYRQIDLRRESGFKEMIEVAKYLRTYSPRKIRQKSRLFIEKISIMQSLLKDLNQVFG